MERTNVKHSSGVKMSKKWHESYELFVAYKKEFPDTPVPYNAEYHGYKLGHWVDTERRRYKKGKLSAERIKLLEQAGIMMGSYEEDWQQGYGAFVAYKKEFPDVPASRETKYHDLNLGRWIHTQRTAKKKGTLSAERIKRLEEADIVWEIRKSATELLVMFERGENIFLTNYIFPDCIRQYLLKKYNNSCAIGQVDLNNFTILPESKQILDGKNCGYNGKKPNGNPNLDLAHLDDIYSNNTIKNLLPLCRNCHGEITYTPKQTKEHLRKANVNSSRKDRRES